MDSLDQQLSNMHMVNKVLPTQQFTKKVPPAVPPKRKKAQPQVPQSFSVKSACEPSFSTRLQGNSAPVYSNMSTSNNGNISYNNKYDSPINNFSQTSSNRNHVYGNLPSQYEWNRNDYFPPPPPPYVDTQNTSDIPSPPSPVSSNYSELVRATNANYQHPPAYPPSMYRPDYGQYGGSRASPSYESLYEPINPRPPSQTSADSNTSYNPEQTRRPKEVEVDALTDLLVQSIDDGQDLDTYGTCVECGKKVTAEASGCTAMDRVYHVQCFTCRRCRVNLQGKPFYAVDGQPHCKEDYLETLEKCSVCGKSILDRILRATGKPYHPACFGCVVCGKSLDGVPFTVDAANRIHCIEDFHKKFAPRCCVCSLPIMPEAGQEETVRVVALDRSFHVACYRCEDCGLQLSSEARGRGCYPLDRHILCKSCNARRVRALTNVMTTDL